MKGKKSSRKFHLITIDIEEMSFYKSSKNETHQKIAATFNNREKVCVCVCERERASYV